MAKRYFAYMPDGSEVEITIEQARTLAANGQKFQVEDAPLDTTLTPLDSGKASGAPADNTGTGGYQERKPERFDTEAAANLAALEPDKLTTSNLLLPRLSANVVAGKRFQDLPGNYVWNTTKDIASLPGRAAAGLLSGGMYLLGEGAPRAAREFQSAMASPGAPGTPEQQAELGNIPGLMLKDPLNVLLPAAGSAAGALTKIPVVAKLGAAAGEGADIANANTTRRSVSEIDDLLRRRAEHGLNAALRAEQGAPPVADDWLSQYLVQDELTTPATRQAAKDYIEGATHTIVDPSMSQAAKEAEAVNEAIALDPMLERLRSSRKLPRPELTRSPVDVAKSLGYWTANVRNKLEAIPGAIAPNSLPQRIASFAGNQAANAGAGALRVGGPLVAYNAINRNVAGQETSGSDVLRDLTLGTLPYMAGKSLVEAGAANFPGINPALATPRTASASARTSTLENIDELLGGGYVPRTKEGYLSATQQKLKTLGDVYNTAAEQILPSYTVPVEDLVNEARATLLDLANKGVGGIALGRPKYNELGERIPQLDPKIEEMLADAQLQAAAQEHRYIPKLAMNDIATTTQDPYLTGKGLLDLRKHWSKKELYRDPATNTPSEARKYVYESLHDAANKSLNQAPVIKNAKNASTYGEYLADTPHQYGMWKSFQDVLTTPGSLGLQHRLSENLPVVGKFIGGLAAERYMVPSSLYAAGKYTQRLAPGIAKGLGVGLDKYLAPDSTGVK